MNGGTIVPEDIRGAAKAEWSRVLRPRVLRPRVLGPRVKSAEVARRAPGLQCPKCVNPLACSKGTLEVRECWKLWKWSGSQRVGITRRIRRGIPSHVRCCWLLPYPLSVSLLWNECIFSLLHLYFIIILGGVRSLCSEPPALSQSGRLFCRFALRKEREHIFFFFSI